MTKIITFFAADVTSLLFFSEKKDIAGYSSSFPESIEEAWQRDMYNLSSDAGRALEKVLKNEPKAVEA